MNWQFILLQLVALVGLVSFTLAAVYYIRHRHARAKAVVDGMRGVQTDDGGKFLKRYVPPEHRQTEAGTIRFSLFANRSLFYLTSTLVPALFLVFTATNYYLNREQFIEDIVLEESERLGLSSNSYSFDAPVNRYAQSLAEVVNNVDSERNIVILRNEKGGNYLPDAWLALLDQDGLNTKACTYQKLASCKINIATTVILSMQGSGAQMAGRLHNLGVNVLAYGFPSNLLKDANSIPGLTFVASDGVAVSHLAVVGDRELTLGIDAGTNFAIERLAKGIRVESEQPQAISMFTDRIAGGPIDTRLFATVKDSTRLVWMDFSVADRNYMDTEQKSLFDLLIAGVLRYATGQSYGTIATWPNGRRYAAFFEQDTEFGYANSDRVANLFSDLESPVTWYVLSDLANDYRSITRQLAAVGEMACHGDNHDIMPRYTVAGQTERLARCMKVVNEITGEMPRGFRPPTEAHNTDTFSAMINTGMTHVFAENSGVTQVPHIKMANGSGKQLVSVPRGISDDFYLWHDLKLDGPSSVRRMRDELAWIRTAGSLFGFSFHSQFMADDPYFEVLKTLVTEVTSDAGVYLDTVGGISDWWLVRDTLLRGGEVDEEQMQRFSPTRLNVNSAGELVSMLLPSPLQPPVVTLANQDEQ